MARKDLMSTQTGGATDEPIEVGAEGTQSMDLSPKETEAEKEIEEEVEKSAQSQMKNISTLKTPSKPEESEASNYMPVSQASEEGGIPQSPQDSTAKGVLEGQDYLQDQEKTFNQIGGLDDVYSESSANKSKEIYDSSLDPVMNDNNVIIKDANIDDSDLFDSQKIKTSVTKGEKIIDGTDVIKGKEIINDIDEESDENISISGSNEFLSTDLDREINELNSENLENNLVSRGTDGFRRIDVVSAEDGEPDEDEKDRGNGYYFMKGRAYYKNNSGDWYKLYPTEKWKKKKYREEGYNTYNSKWVKLEDKNRISAIERKGDYQPYGEVKRKNLFKVSNDLIRQMQEAYNDPIADMSGDIQYEQEVSVSERWSYTDFNREDALEKINRKSGFLSNGNYKFTGKDFEKKSGKWYYKSDNGNIEIPFGKEEQIINLEKHAIPLSQVNSKNESIINIVQSIQTSNVSDVMTGILGPVSMFLEDKIESSFIKGFDWIKSINKKSGESINDRAAELALDITDKFYSGNLTEAEFEIIKSFGVLKDQYNIDSESVGDIGDIWRKPDKAYSTGVGGKDISDLYNNDEYKNGAEVIAFLAKGNSLKANTTSNGIYHVGADYLMRRDGQWMYTNGEKVTDRNLIKTFDNSGSPGVFGIGEALFPGIKSVPFTESLNSKKDLPVVSEITAITSGSIQGEESVRSTDIYQMYNSNSVMKELIRESLASSSDVSSMELLRTLENPSYSSRLSPMISGLTGGNMNAIRNINEAFVKFNKFEKDKQRVRFFAKNNFSESNFSDEQRSVIEKSQEQAEDLLESISSDINESGQLTKETFSTYRSNLDRFISQMDSFASVSSQNNEIVQQIESSGNSKDKSFFLRKQTYTRKLAEILPTGASDLLQNSLDLYKKKKSLAEYVIKLEEEGLVDIDDKGVMSYNSERIKSKGGQRYLEQIERKLDDLNTSIATSRQDTWDKNSEELAEIEASLRNIPTLKEDVFNKFLSAESEEEKESYRNQYEKLKQTEETLTAKSNNINIRNYAVLMTMPEKFAEDISSSVNSEVINPYLKALQDMKSLSAKNKYDLLTENIIDRMESLVTSEDIDVGYADRVVDKFKDLLSWPGFLELSDSEKEYYQLAKTVKSLLPIYLNNEYGFTKDEVGFFESFFGSMYRTAFPITGPASGGGGIFYSTDIVSEKEVAEDVRSVTEDLGLTDRDFTSRQRYDELISEADKVSEVLSREFFGEVFGGSTVYMSAIMISGGVINGLYKLGVGLSRLAAPRLGGATLIERTRKGIPTVYNATLGTTRLGRFLKEPMEMALRYKAAGVVIGATKEEMTLSGGLMGGIGVKGLQLLGQKVSLTAFNKFSESLFGAEKWASITSNIQYYGGLGIGELAEETGQAFAKAWNQTDSMKGMFSALEEQYGTLNAKMKHIVGSVVAGAVMGAGLSNKSKSMYDGLNSEQKQIVDSIIKEVGADLNSSADAVKEYIEVQGKKIVNTQENSKVDDSKDTERVSSKKQKGEESIEEKPVEETSKKETSDSGVLQEEKTEAKEDAKKEQAEETDTQPKEQVEQEKSETETLQEQFDSLSEEQKKQYIAKAKYELKEESKAERRKKRKTRRRLGLDIFKGGKVKYESGSESEVTGSVTSESIEKRAGEIYAKENVRKNIGKNINTVKGQRVTITVNKNSDSPGVDMKISDEFGNDIGTVKGIYDGKGNFRVEEISITEGKRGKQYATEVIDVINQNTKNNVIITKSTESTEAVGKSVETNGDAVEDVDGDYVVNNTKQNTDANEEARVEYKEDLTLADKIRAGKFSGPQTVVDENGNTVPAPKRNSLNFFDAAWNTSLEAAAIVAEKGGTLFNTIQTARNKFKNTAFYQSFTTEAEKEEQMARFVMALEEKLGTEEFAEAEKAYTSLKKKAVVKFKKSDYYTSLVKDDGSPDLSARRKALKDFRDKLSTDADKIISERMKAKDLRDVDSMVTEYAADARMESEDILDRKESISRKVRRAQEKENKKDPSYLPNLKKEIIAYMEKALPSKKYTKKQLISFTKQIEAAKTVAQANKIFKRIDKVTEKTSEQTRQQSINKTLNRVKKMFVKGKGEVFYKKGNQKITPEAQTNLSNLMTEYGLTAEGAQSSLESMSNAEIVALNNAMDEIITTGKTDQSALKEEIENVKRSERAKVLEGFDQLRYSRLSPEDAIEQDSSGSFIIDGKMYNKSDGQAFIKKTLNDENTPNPKDIRFYESMDNTTEGKQTKAWTYNFLSIGDVYANSKKLYGRKKGTKGNKALKEYIEDKIEKPMRTAFAMEQRNTYDFQQKIKSELDRLFPASKTDIKKLAGIRSILPSTLSKNVFDSSNDSRFYEKKGGALKSEFSESVKLNNDQIIDLYLYGKDVESREKLESQGYKMDAIDSYIDENKNLKDYAEFISKQYNEYARERFEPVFAKYKDVPGFGKSTEYYYPRSTRIKGNKSSDQEAADKMLIDAHGAKGFFIGSKTAGNNHLETRKGMGPEVTLEVSGATAKLLDYTGQMEHAKEFMPIAEATSLLTNNPEVSNAIKNNAGNSNYNTWKDHMNVILSGQNKIEGSNKFVDNITTLGVVTTLGFEIKNLGKQTTSSFHWMNAGLKYGMPLFNISLKNISQTFEKGPNESNENYNQRVAITKMIMNSAFVKGRWKGGDLDVALSNVYNEANKGGYKSMLKKGSQFALFATRLGDMAGVVLGGVPFTVKLYKKFRTPIEEGGRGMSHEQAMDAAYVAFTAEATDVQQSSRADNVSMSQRNGLVRLMTTYTTSQQAMLKRTINAFRSLRNWDMQSKSQKKQAVWDMIYYPVFGNMIFNAVASGYIAGMIYDDTDDEKDPDVRFRGAYDLIMDTIQSDIQGLGVAGKLVDWAINSARGRDFYNTYPVMKTMVQAAESPTGLYKTLTKDAEIKIGETSIPIPAEDDVNKQKLAVDDLFNDILSSNRVFQEFIEENKNLISERSYKELTNKSDVPRYGDKPVIARFSEKSLTEAREALDKVIDAAKGQTMIDRATEYLTSDIPDSLLDYIGKFSEAEGFEEVMEAVMEWDKIKFGKTVRSEGDPLTREEDRLKREQDGVPFARDEDVSGSTSSKIRKDYIFESLFGEPYVMDKMITKGFFDLDYEEKVNFQNILQVMDPVKYSNEKLERMNTDEYNKLWTEFVNYGVQYQDFKNPTQYQIEEIKKGDAKVGIKKSIKNETQRGKEMKLKTGL